jgi:hypothetical protein
VEELVEQILKFAEKYNNLVALSKALEVLHEISATNLSNPLGMEAVLVVKYVQ